MILTFNIERQLLQYFSYGRFWVFFCSNNFYLLGWSNWLQGDPIESLMSVEVIGFLFHPIPALTISFPSRFIKKQTHDVRLQPKQHTTLTILLSNSCLALFKKAVLIRKVLRLWILGDLFEYIFFFFSIWKCDKVWKLICIMKYEEKVFRTTFIQIRSSNN